MQRRIPPGRAFSCTTPTLARSLAALSVTCNLREWKQWQPLQREDRSHSPPFRTSAKLRQIPPHRPRRRATPTTSPTGFAPAGRAPCAHEQRGHPRRLADASDFSQWAALVNHIPTPAFRLNGFYPPAWRDGHAYEVEIVDYHEQ